MGKLTEAAVSNHKNWYSCSGSVLCAFAKEADLWLGADMLAAASDRSPAESLEFMIRHLLYIMPKANESTLRKELK